MPRLAYILLLVPERGEMGSFVLLVPEGGEMEDPFNNRNIVTPRGRRRHGAKLKKAVQW